MKYLITLLLTINLLAIEIDKKKHFEGSLILSLNTQYIVKNKFKTFAYVFGIGIAKEIIDKLDYGKFDKKDILYDFYGNITGIFISNYLSRYPIELQYKHNKPYIFLFKKF